MVGVVVGPGVLGVKVKFGEFFEDAFVTELRAFEEGG